VGPLSQGVLAIAITLGATSCGSQKPAITTTAVASKPAPIAAEPAKAAATNEDRRKQIYTLLHAKRDAYRGCFRSAHAAHNEIDTIEVTIVVALKPSGEIVSVTRKEGTPDEQAAMMECIHASVRSITFPPHPKGKETTVRYPLTFSSGRQR
jgi:hypothetical protein